MIVKVCGVRTAAIAAAAVEAGADWIGLVFVAGSPRTVDDATAGEVAGAIAGDADLIGVFMEPSPAECMRAVNRHHLAAVQVHGEVERDLVTAVDVPVVRGINVEAGHAYTDQWWPDGLLLVDAVSREGELPGGTGRRIDVAFAAELARHRRILLAGGLTPDTVADAIRAVKPIGVDASSGLESAPGVKDERLVRAYVEAARNAGASVTASP